MRRSSLFVGTLAALWLLMAGCQRETGVRAPAQAQARFVRANGVRLQVFDWGGTGDGLVFIHGLGDSPHAFDDIAPAFRDRFHVIAYARRGHGRSEVKGPYDHATLVEDLRQLLDSLAIRRAVLVGWSLGGNEMSELAVLHPERVSGLVYLECYDLGDPGFTRMFEHYPVAYNATGSDLASAAAFRDWWKRTLAPGTPFTPGMEAEIADLTEPQPDGSVRVVTNDSITAALFAGAVAYHPSYAAIRAPILAMWGHWYRGGLIPGTASDSLRDKVDRYLSDYVRPVQDSAVARLRAAAPGARIVVLDSAGHGQFPFQARDTIIAEMRQFLVARPN
jgi:pimeloyl-ACP methyl ester carboxylesterase